LLLQGLAQQPSEQKEVGGSIRKSTSSTNDVASESNAKNDLSEAYKVKKPDSFGFSEPNVGPDMPFLRAPQPNIKNKRVLELLQKRKDWVYLEPTDEEFGLTAEAIFNLPSEDEDTEEEKEEKEMTPMERFYHRNGDKDDGATNGVAEVNVTDEEEKNSTSLRGVWANENDNGVKSSDTPQARFFSEEKTSSFQTTADTAGRYSSFERERAKGNGAVDAEAAKAQEARMNEFRKLLDTHYPMPSRENLSGGGGNWYDPASPWNISAPRPAVPNGRFSPPPVPSQAPIGTLPAGGAAPVFSRPYQDVPTLPGFPSLTPALPVEEKRRPTIPEPIYTKPKTHF
jgi:hypothetical protein